MKAETVYTSTFLKAEKEETYICHVNYEVKESEIQDCTFWMVRKLKIGGFNLLEQ